ncbi:MAG: cytochrome c1 [Rhizobiaceae bacterium]|nr:cytochrome c1 [Rhizobiaceae bacterium]
MKMMIAKIAGLAIAAVIAVTGASYAAGGPKIKPKEVDWSFAGPFGTWDLGQLQRGFKVYQEVCASCHSIDLIAFRNLQEIGFSEAQVKAIAAEYEVTDGPNADGEMFERTAVPSDLIPGPYANAAEAAAVNNGAAPPDFSLLAKARAVERGFPTFVFDMFTLYAENGPDYIYSLLTGYKDAPEGKELPEGTHYNPYFIAGEAIAMGQPLYGDDVEYDDGTEATIEQQSKDVSAFMMWAAEPYLVERKQMGFKVIAFLLIFSILLYLTKKSVFRQLKSA